MNDNEKGMERRRGMGDIKVSIITDERNKKNDHK